MTRALPPIITEAQTPIGFPAVFVNCDTKLVWILSDMEVDINTDQDHRRTWNCEMKFEVDFPKETCKSERVFHRLSAYNLNETLLCIARIRLPEDDSIGGDKNASSRMLSTSESKVKLY